MPFSQKFRTNWPTLLGKIKALLLLLMLWSLQPAYSNNSMWQQYHAFGKLALRCGDWNLAERYLIGSAQEAHRKNIGIENAELQDLGADLIRLNNIFKAVQNDQEAQYIARWQKALGTTPTVLSFQPGAPSAPSQEANFGNLATTLTKNTLSSDTTHPALASFSSSGGSGYGQAYPSSAINTDGGGPERGGRDGDCNRRGFDCDREYLEQALRFLKKSMDDCANGINKIDGLAR